MKRLVVILLISFAVTSTYGQEEQMTIEVNNIDITAKPQEAALAIGSKISSLKHSVIESSKSLSLSELLTENSVVYIKSYGQGALSTSSFRGTSSSHTSVNWNGININPSMSGSFDFSKIPVFFVDDVMLRHGSGGTSTGSGALGGSIYLSNSPQWSDTTHLKAFLEAGSYSTYTAAASVNIDGEKAKHRIRVYYTSSENDYKYLNKVFSVESFYENREQSSYLSSSIMQESYIKVKDGTLSSNIWLSYGDRELPQPITVNVTKLEDERDGSLKYSLKYDKSYGNHFYEVAAGYLFDIMEYKKSFKTSSDVTRNLNKSHRAVAKGRYQYDLKSNLVVGAVTSYTLDAVVADSYTDGNVSRGAVVINGYSIWKPSAKIETTAEATLDVTGGVPGGLFSAGMSSPIVNNLLSFSQSLSYNRKYPSLNDLYWTPGGNPDLDPEKGISYDVTLSLKPKIAGLAVRLDATYYIMNIHDWIVWLPTDSYFWSPQNMKRVVSQGAEIMAEVGFSSGDVRHRITANYTYSSSQNREASSASDASVGKQLPYIPLNKFNARYTASWRGVSGSLSGYYTSKRYTTTDNSYYTDGYTIYDAQASYEIRSKGRFSVTPRVRVNNIFNEYYESIQYYPMPLRSFSLGATLSF